MIAFNYLAIALYVIAGLPLSLGAPTEPAPLYTRDLEERIPEFDFFGNLSMFMARQDYNQNYETGGNVNYSPSSNGYSVKFSGAQDFVVGKGWTTGSARNIKLSGTHQATSGTILLAVYGWTTNPLVEYYIQETYTSYSGGTYKGTVTSDGSNYDIYQHQQTNQPSIQGTATFQQYISIRKNKRSSGTVTTANHFNAWAKLGMKLGSYKYQVVATEGWGNAAGSTNMQVS